MSRIRPRRETPRRRAAPRWFAADWAEANRLMERRSGGRCEMCGKPRTATERHHRQRRQVGGDRLANVILLHPACHQYVTEHPDEAMAFGLIVSSYAEDPAAVPMQHGVLGHVYLDDEGSTQSARPPAPS